MNSFLLTLRSIAIAFLSCSFCLSAVAAQSGTHDATARENVFELNDGWTMQSSCKVDKPGEVLSTPRFQSLGWYSVSVPTTVVAALVKQKVYPDPEFGLNLRKFPGMTYPIGENFSNFAM